MFAVRLASAVALILWVGGAMTIAGLSAPAAFAVLPSAEAASVVGELLRRYHLAAYGAGAIVVAALVLDAVLGPRPLAFWARLWIAGVMLAATLASGLWINPRAAALRQEAASAGDAVSARQSFARWHRASVALLALTLAGGLVLVYWEIRPASSSLDAER